MQSPGRIRDYELIAGHPALDLVNTLDWRFREDGPEELLESYDDLLGFAEQSQLLSPRHARRLARIPGENEGNRVLTAIQELREAIAEVLYAALEGRKPGAETLKVLERFFKTAHAHRHLGRVESRLAWDWTDADSTQDLPLWQLASAAEQLITSDKLALLRECGNPECRWLFLDTSKNHTRRWCEMRICGNRMKARRFKAQRRG